MAEGLTVIDAELLEQIHPDEIIDGAWMKRGEKVREFFECVYICVNMCANVVYITKVCVCVCVCVHAKVCV